MPFLVNTRRRRVKKKKACSTFSITYLNPIKLRSLIFAQFLHWQNIFSPMFKWRLKMSSKRLHEICQNTGFLWFVFSHMWADLYPYFPVFRQNLWFCPNTGKYGYDSVHIRQNSCSLTVWNMPKYGLSLTRNFRYMDRIVSVFSRFWTELEILSK